MCSDPIEACRCTKPAVQYPPRYIVDQVQEDLEELCAHPSCLYCAIDGCKRCCRSLQTAQVNGLVMCYCRKCMHLFCWWCGEVLRSGCTCRGPQGDDAGQEHYSSDDTDDSNNSYDGQHDVLDDDSRSVESEEALFDDIPNYGDWRDDDSSVGVNDNHSDVASDEDDEMPFRAVLPSFLD